MTEVREVEAVAKAWLIYADNGMLIKAVTSEQERDSLLFTNGGKFPTWTAEPLYTSPTPANASDEAVRAAYEMGWHAAARWGDRDDLHADVGSSAYTNERDAALAEVAKMLGDGR